MTKLSERLNTPISTPELNRRWTAVRAAMEEQGIDVLLMQNNNDHMGGYVKYFTDAPATCGYPLTVVFPRDDAMTVVQQGPFGVDRELAVEGDGVYRGVKRMMTTPSYASVPYSKEYDAELAATALAPYAGATVGLVGSYQISFAFVDSLRRGVLSGARLVDASDLVDRIKVIKSEEEQALIRATAAMQDTAMRAALDAIEPGKRDSDIAAVAQHVGEELGSEQGIFLCASAPLGTPIQTGPRHQQHRVLREGDVFVLLVENNGAGGFFTELGRTAVLGAVPQEMRDEFGFTLEAQKFTLDLLVPGTPCPEIWAAYNDFMRANGRPEERRLFCHGQGYDLVERPLVRHDEPMSIEANMNIVCHPAYELDTMMSWVCDNYLIGRDGPGACLHAFPQEIVSV